MPLFDGWRGRGSAGQLLAVVDELQWDPEVVVLQRLDHILEDVPRL
jgi:hypothetical protein